MHNPQSQDQPEEVRQEVTILNSQGLHARPVMQFVDTAAQFASDVKVQCNDTIVDGKSPMEMMLLAATQGTRILLTARGKDATDAVDALKQLVENRFGEE